MPNTAHRLPLQTFAITLIGAPAFFVIALSQLFATAEGGLLVTPPLWLPGAYAAYAVAAHLIVEHLTYRATPIPATLAREEAEPLALSRYKTAMATRFLILDTIIPVALAAAMLVGKGGFLAFLVAVLLATPLMVLHVYPNRRTVTKTEAALDRDGGASHLSELLGLAAGHGERAALTPTAATRPPRLA